jgi:uncharacterized protein YndB with AHSA1/START domain
MATVMVTPDQDTIVSEIQIAAAPERVFKALTDAGELGRWFGGSDCPEKAWHMDARVGGKYGYTAEARSSAANGSGPVECHGEILECDPPRVLTYTWIANWHEDRAQQTVVRWELTPKQGGTHVRVTHSGLATLPVARKDYSGGWPGVVEKLKQFVER